MGDLELDTTLTGADGRYTITLSPEWEIWGPNGGYLAALALRAAGMESQIGRPASIACHFLAVARFEPVELEVRTVQQGRRAESFHVLMTQQGKPIVQAIIRTAAEGPGVEHDLHRMPEVPPPAALKSFLDHHPDAPAGPLWWTNIESRIILPERLFAEEPQEPHLLEWYRFIPRSTFENPFVDACRYVLLMDTFAWPAAGSLYPMSTRQFDGVNLDVVCWFHRLDSQAEWLLCDYRSEIAGGGVASGEGRVWSEDGRLLASGGAQLMCVPARPRDA